MFCSRGRRVYGVRVFDCPLILILYENVNIYPIQHTDLYLSHFNPSTIMLKSETRVDWAKAWPDKSCRWSLFVFVDCCWTWFLLFPSMKSSRERHGLWRMSCPFHIVSTAFINIRGYVRQGHTDVCSDSTQWSRRPRNWSPDSCGIMLRMHITYE